MNHSTRVFFLFFSLTVAMVRWYSITDLVTCLTASNISVINLTENEMWITQSTWPSLIQSLLLYISFSTWTSLGWILFFYFFVFFVYDIWFPCVVIFSLAFQWLCFARFFSGFCFWKPHLIWNHLRTDCVKNNEHTHVIDEREFGVKRNWVKKKTKTKRHETEEYNT